MGSWPKSSSLDAQTETFPALTPDQMARLQKVGRPRQVVAGEVLYQPGDRSVPMFVLVSGRLQILQPTYNGERLIHTHEPGGFTGEFSMISGQPCLALGRVETSGEFLEVSPDQLRALVASDTELGDIFMRAFILRRLTLIDKGFGNVILMGSRHSADTLRLREFLTRNNHPYNYIDLDTDSASQEMLDRFHVKTDEIPVIICDGSRVLRNPTNHGLADCLGLNTNVDRTQIRDLVIVGAGPAGLAAAVYAASEGLDVLLIEQESPGGQAGSSSRIENYLGFPTGISGQELAARAIAQAQKFGTNMLIARTVSRLECDRRPYQLVLDDGSRLPTRCVIIATGAQYNKLNVSNMAEFEGKGIYYGATFIEAQLCQQEDVIVVGGGNSAGQAAIFLSETSRKVHMLVRSGNLAQSMSRYLIHRIADNPAIQLHMNTEIVGLEGNGRLEAVTWRDKLSGKESRHDIGHVFVMAGASPRTTWLRGCINMDDAGFIRTGRDLDSLGDAAHVSMLPSARVSQMLETNLPGVFAVGDVRANSVKRVASAVGEGAIAIHLVHKALQEMGT